MAGEPCPYKTGCKYYPTDTSDDPQDCAHYFGGHGYHVDAAGRHYMRVSTAKGLIDRSDPDLVSWILAVARDLYGATKEEQKGPAWPKRGDARIGKGEVGGWSYWDAKVKKWLPKQWLDRRFRDAYFVTEQWKDCSAMAGTLIHWYMDTRLWGAADFEERFNPGPPPPLPPAFEVQLVDGEAGQISPAVVVDYADTVPERKRQVDRFIELFRPQLIAREQKMFSTSMGIAGSFDSMLMFPTDAVNMYCRHVVGVQRDPWLDIDLAQGLSRPFDGQEVVLVDWKTAKKSRPETVVQLGLYYLMLKEGEGKIQQAHGVSLPVPVRLMTARFFAPQALEARDPANRPHWEVVDVPVALAVELATEALEEARKLGAIF